MTDPEAMNARAELRSNVFLTAIIDLPGGSLPVRVRNLSSGGALVEGAALPDQGNVRLRRGDLHVCGKVAWHSGSYCGLQFDSAVDVPAWIKKFGHRGQNQVDVIVATLRTGAIPQLSEISPPQGPAQIGQALLEIAEQLSGIDGLSVEAGEQILKIESLARILQGWSPRTGRA